MRRSRSAFDCGWARYSRQSVWVSSACATGTKIRLRPAYLSARTASVPSQRASAAAAAATTARRPAPPLAVAAAKAIPPNPSASSEKSAPSAVRFLFVFECLIALALVLAEALSLLLVESVLIVTLLLRLEILRVLSVAHAEQISGTARLQSCRIEGA